MKKSIPLSVFHYAVLLGVLSTISFPGNTVQAGPGDTLVVQTFSWGWPVNPGFNNPREGKFFFPTQDKQYEKILLRYTLKCDPAQNPPCGEWDYLTYTRLYEHTGRYDSLQLTHPNFTVFGTSPDTLRYMNSPLPILSSRAERSAKYASIVRIDTSILGTETTVTDAIFSTEANDARSYILWTRPELVAAGITTDTLTALRFRVADTGGRADRFTVRLRRHSGTLWQEDIPLQQSGFVTVFDAALDFEENGWATAVFIQPFLVWGGSLLAEITVHGGSGIRIAADTSQGEGFACVSRAPDRFLNFQQGSYVDCGYIPELDQVQTFTVEAWFKADVLRNWSNIVYTGTDNEHRVAIQLGGLEDGRADVYCIVGNGDNSYGYTSGRPIGEGLWYHVAMVYDGTAEKSADQLTMYLNGNRQTLRFNGNFPAVTAALKQPFTISSAGANTITGGMDEIRIWRAALSETEIRSRMHSRILETDSLYRFLISLWDCDDDDDTMLSDRSGQHNGRLMYPVRSSYRGDRPRGYVSMDARPVVELEHGNATLSISTKTIIDTLYPAPMLVILYGDTSKANIATDSVIAWPAGFTYLLSPENDILDSIAVTADHLLLKRTHFYYGAPFEITNRYELARYITPYGIGLDLGEGWTWVWDVTDFAPLLRDTVHLTAGNFQELLDMKFLFIEGTPPRDVLKIENVWQGDYALKDFSAQVRPKIITLDPDAESFKLRTTATGHQFSNATNCAEFCPKIHSILVDGKVQHSWQILQECSMNPLYPQGGTWIYARAGWCPGMEAAMKEFELTKFISGTEVEIGYESQYDEFGNYVFEAQLVSYGKTHHQLDAAIDRIVAPDNYELHRRFNPTCGRPRIVIQNRGASTLNSVTITYGYQGGNTQQHIWTGSLELMEKEEIWLPPLNEFPNTDKGVFEVMLSAPNGGQDEYALNDTRQSHFSVVPVYDSRLIVHFRTNNAPNENRYEVLDAVGTVVHSRSGFAANTMYHDTLRLIPGCYEFILHDSDEDGIAWWANNDGNGSLQFQLEGGGVVSTVNPDFGKQARYPFIYSSLVAVHDIMELRSDITLYPNPVNESFSVRVNVASGNIMQYRIYDMLGQLLAEGGLRNGVNTINTATLSPGNYVLLLVNGAMMQRRVCFNVVR